MDCVTSRYNMKAQVVHRKRYQILMKRSINGKFQQGQSKSYSLANEPKYERPTRHRHGHIHVSHVLLGYVSSEKLSSFNMRREMYFQSNQSWNMCTQLTCFTNHEII